MPLTIKSIKGYIYHNLIESSADEEQTMFTYSVCYLNLARALNEHFNLDVKITRKDFKNNSITDSRYLSFCYSLLQDSTFQKELKKDIKDAIVSSNNLADAMFDEIHFD